jgi:superfamily II DNA helicase RecQ
MMRQISGVGARKLDAYGEDCLAVIRDHDSRVSP